MLHVQDYANNSLIHAMTYYHTFKTAN